MDVGIELAENLCALTLQMFSSIFGSTKGSHLSYLKHTIEVIVTSDSIPPQFYLSPNPNQHENSAKSEFDFDPNSTVKILIQTLWLIRSSSMTYCRAWSGVGPMAVELHNFSI